MWAWLIGGAIAVLVLLAVVAGIVSFTANDEKKRRDARQMFTQALTAVMGASGLFAVALLLHQAGML